MKRVAASLLALSFVTPAAQAADLIIDTPVDRVAVAGFDWSGFYAGVFAGYGGGRPESFIAATGAVSPVDTRGGLLGATVGANAQFDMFVLGVEGDVAWSGIEGSDACEGAPGFQCNGRLDWTGSAKVRGGVALDRLLVFGTLGLAAGGINASTTPTPAGTTGSYETTVYGWTVGAGAEYAVTEAISVKAEYAYTDFGTTQAPAGTLAGSPDDLTISTHVAKVGVNLHF